MNFKKFLLEIKDDLLSVNSISKDIINKENFNNIFGDSMRILIPFEYKEPKIFNKIREGIKSFIKSKFRDIQLGQNAFYNNKELNDKIKRIIKKDDEYEIDLDNLVVNVKRKNLVGRIENKKIDIKKFIEDFLENPEQLIGVSIYQIYNFMDDVFNKNKYSIILSRHPIDVVRMSDHSGLESCHSPPGKNQGSYFDCAVQEAKNQGLVAYLVKSEDLNSIKEKLNSPEEIFDDKDRNIKGIKPVARLRVRKLENLDIDKFSTNKNNFHLAVPEKIVYGNNISGFKEAISEFLKKKQKKLIDQTHNFNFAIVGGEYADTDAKELLSSFLDKNIDAFEKDDNFSQYYLDGKNILRSKDKEKFKQLIFYKNNLEDRIIGNGPNVLNKNIIFNTTFNLFDEFITYKIIFKFDIISNLKIPANQIVNYIKSIKVPNASFNYLLKETLFMRTRDKYNFSLLKNGNFIFNNITLASNSIVHGGNFHDYENLLKNLRSVNDSFEHIEYFYEEKLTDQKLNYRYGDYDYDY